MRKVPLAADCENMLPSGRRSLRRASLCVSQGIRLVARNEGNGVAQQCHGDGYVSSIAVFLTAATMQWTGLEKYPFIFSKRAPRDPCKVPDWERLGSIHEEQCVGLKAVDVNADMQAATASLREELQWLAASAGGLGLLTSVFDALPMAIYTTDAEGRLVFCNGHATALLGGAPGTDAQDWDGGRYLTWPDGTAMSPELCPMNLALRERRPIRGAEAVVARPDRASTRVMIYATPLLDGEALIGGVNMLVEVGERDRVSYLEQRLAAIVECSEDAIISKDLNGTIVTWNHAAERLFGYTAAEAIGRPVLMLIPEDRQQEEAAILRSIRNGNPVARYETLRRRKDGTLVPIALTVSPLRDASGRIIGASKIARDISDQVRMREQQALVLNEMSHRVKNVLAVAGGLVGLSARSADSPRAMAKAVQERLGAYSRAHDLTRAGAAAQGTAGRTTLHTLVEAIVAPYVVPTDAGDNVAIEGEDVAIDADATASLALVLHEFTTNAAKYGAFSVPTGRVRIESRVVGDAFELVWTERDGPCIVGPPTRQGFGSVLAAKIVEGQLGGKLHYEWQAEGLMIRMVVPRGNRD